MSTFVSCLKDQSESYTSHYVPNIFFLKNILLILFNLMNVLRLTVLKSITNVVHISNYVAHS